MNLRKMTKDHVKGMILGICTPLVFIPLVLLIIVWTQDYYFTQIWSKFKYIADYRVKMITISIIANLGWFYLFLNKERYNVAMGVILGSVAYAPYIIYIKFF